MITLTPEAIQVSRKMLVSETILTYAKGKVTNDGKEFYKGLLYALFNAHGRCKEMQNSVPTDDTSQDWLLAVWSRIQAYLQGVVETIPEDAVWGLDGCTLRWSELEVKSCREHLQQSPMPQLLYQGVLSTLADEQLSVKLGFLSGMALAADTLNYAMDHGEPVNFCYELLEAYMRATAEHL